MSPYFISNLVFMQVVGKIKWLIFTWYSSILPFIIDCNAKDNSVMFLKVLVKF